MSDLIDASQFLSSPEEDQAAVLVEAWLRSARESPTSRAASCPPRELLAEYCAGVTTEAREILQHLAECSQCRKQTVSASPWSTGTPALALGVPGLRRAVLAYPEVLKPWIVRLRQGLARERESARTSSPEFDGLALAATLDAHGNENGCAGLRWDRPPTLDDCGRLRLRLTPASSMSNRSLLLCLSVAGIRLNLCAIPVVAGAIDAIIDLGFLQAPAGELPRARFRLAFAPPGAAGSFLQPGLLGGLRALTADGEGDLIEFWDACVALAASAGEGWVTTLQREIAEAPDRAAATAILAAASKQVRRFEGIWVAANGTTPEFGDSLIRGLEHVLEWSPENDEVETPPTVPPRRDSHARIRRDGMKADRPHES